MKSVIICDMEGWIEIFNKGVEEMFGYFVDEVIGKEWVFVFFLGEIVF